VQVQAHGMLKPCPCDSHVLASNLATLESRSTQAAALDKTAHASALALHQSKGVIINSARACRQEQVEREEVVIDKEIVQQPTTVMKPVQTDVPELIRDKKVVPQVHEEMRKLKVVRPRTEMRTVKVKRPVEVKKMCKGALSSRPMRCRRRVVALRALAPCARACVHAHGVMCKCMHACMHASWDMALLAHRKPCQRRVRSVQASAPSRRAAWSRRRNPCGRWTRSTSRSPSSQITRRRSRRVSCHGGALQCLARAGTVCPELFRCDAESQAQSWKLAVPQT
jgi:hypothetical protein